MDLVFKLVKSFKAKTLKSSDFSPKSKMRRQHHYLIKLIRQKRKSRKLRKSRRRKKIRRRKRRKKKRKKRK